MPTRPNYLAAMIWGRLDGNAEQIPRIHDEPTAAETALADRSDRSD